MLYVRNRVHEKLSAAASTYTPRRDLPLPSSACQSYKRPHKDPLPAVTAQDRPSSPDQWLWLCYLQRRKSAAHMLIDGSRQTEWDSSRCLLEDHKTNLGANIWHYAVWPCANQRQRKNNQNISICVTAEAEEAPEHARRALPLYDPSSCDQTSCDIQWESRWFFLFFLFADVCQINVWCLVPRGDVTVVPMWVTIPRKKSKPPPTPSRSRHWRSCFPGTEFNPPT